MLLKAAKLDWFTGEIIYPQVVSLQSQEEMWIFNTGKKEIGEDILVRHISRENWGQQGGIKNQKKKKN